MGTARSTDSQMSESSPGTLREIEIGCRKVVVTAGRNRIGRKWRDSEMSARDMVAGANGRSRNAMSRRQKGGNKVSRWSYHS